MRRLPNGGGVGAGNDERRGTTAGRVDRAAPRGQAQAQAQAVAAGTSSRLSLLMLCGRDSPETAKLTASLSCNLYILCESVRCFSVIDEAVRLNAVKPRIFVSREFRSYSVRARRALEPGGRLEPWAARARSLL